jgi:hypothetical protein
MAALRAVAAEKMLAHRSRFIGRDLAAITLHTPKAIAALGRSAALSENFLPIDLSGDFPANQLLDVRVTALRSDGALIGFPAGFHNL